MQKGGGGAVSEPVELMPDALYTPEEVAGYLRIERVKSVREIPEADLPRSRVGPGRRLIRFRGRDVLEYVDAAASRPRRKVRVA